ncbi:MAG TPA: hypothetical protein VE399_03270 [Gemmatimonadales bacterium]|nr:hypothetical protein [Gemmatimonadales bacterium]
MRFGSFRHFPSVLALPVLFLLAPIGGCAHTFDATTLGAPVTMATPAGQTVEGSRFRVTSRALFGFWGVLKIKEPSLRKALAAQLGGGSGIAELRIKVRSRWSDVLVTALTAGLVVPRAVTYEGVVLK